MSIERITRSAPKQCFNGGHIGHGPIEPAYNPRFPAFRIALAAIPAAYFAMHFVLAWFGA